MSSTYSTSLRAELIGSGDQAGAWGSTTNGNLSNIFDVAIAGYQTVSVTSASQALTYLNGPTTTAALNQSIYAMLRFTTTTGAAFNVYAPPVSKQYIVYNNSGYSMVIYNSTVIGNTTAAGTGVTVTNGSKVMVWSDGTNFSELQAANLTGTLAVANGGTGATSFTSGALLKGAGTSAVTTASAADIAGQIGTLPIANGGTGVTTITALGNLFYPVGSIYTNAAVSTNPATLLGFGTWTAFGTGRVLVGVDAGDAAFDTLGETGGSKNAITVSHTHTATFTGTALATHNHTITATTSGSDSPQGSLNYPVYNGTSGEGGGTGTPLSPTLSSVSAGTPAGSVTVDSTGSSGTNANLQPYITVYMWQRTA